MHLLQMRLLNETTFRSSRMQNQWKRQFMQSFTQTEKQLLFQEIMAELNNAGCCSLQGSFQRNAGIYGLYIYRRASKKTTGILNIRLRSIPDDETYHCVGNGRDDQSEPVFELCNFQELDRYLKAGRVCFRGEIFRF